MPAAAILGIPMYIRTETMIPIAGVLMAKGVGAGASIPEVSLLASIFKKRMVITFVFCIFFVAVATGYIFNLFF